MIKLYAQPYDYSADGFYFETYKQYKKMAGANRNISGEKVEEYDIQFIDGEALDIELAAAISLNQANLKEFLTACNDWEDDEKILAIIYYSDGLGDDEFGVDVDHDSWDITVTGANTYYELAEQMVNEGLFGDIPDVLERYIDYSAIAADLSSDYSHIEVAGETIIYRAG